ncbi:MAG: metallophosphoesterase [Planctomycetota bacterium]|nr:metallophosphoesterase [Planctomycetota bacterium]
MRAGDSWFTARAGRVRRTIAGLVARTNRLLDAVPGTRSLYERQLFRSLSWTHLDLEVDDQHAGLDGLRFAFLSDLHAGSYLSGAGLERLFALVAELKPDAVLLGGDLVHTRPAEFRLYDRAIERVAPSLGVFAVPGNHERFPGIGLERFHAWALGHGIRVLRNEGTRIGRGRASLWLCGVDDLGEGDPDLGAALAGRNPGEPTLLLSHHPDLFHAAAEHDVRWTLAGHTHGGQVAPFGWMPVRHSKLGFDRGRHRSGGSELYVGRGLGAAIIPLRVHARPEIVVARVGIRRPSDG